MGRKTAEELRRQAKELLEKAKRIEEARALKVGQYVLSLIEKDIPITIEELRERIKQIM